MAFRRGFRRRKPTVAWLPLLGQGANSGDSFITSSIGVNTSTIATTIHSLLPDYPAESVQNVQVESLADYQASGYRLHRVVGKFFACMDQRQSVDQTIYPAWALLAAGLMVLRVDATNGAPLQAATPLNYSPLNRDNTRDPWIWRRSWLLSDSFANIGANIDIGTQEFPRTNAEYGSAWDGPHIDQKTNRRVSAEERLFLIVSTVWPNNGVQPTQAGQIRYVYEARYLSSPMRVMGNRRNASR